MDHNEMLEQQKQQCIFCNIVKGDIPSKKVYEDDVMMAILDINPGSKGHLLVMPKEHYPILPTMPFEQMQHLFEKTQGLVKALKEAMLCKGVTIFIANGVAAGQQSPHFLFHIIPREVNDDLACFDLPSRGDKAGNDALANPLRQRVRAFMNAYLSQTGRDELRVREEAPPTPPKQPTAQAHEVVSETVSESQLDKLIALINENDDLKDALINRVDEVKEAAKTNEKWKELFRGVDIDKLSQNLTVMAAAQAKRKSLGDSPTNDDEAR